MKAKFLLVILSLALGCSPDKSNAPTTVTIQTPDGEVEVQDEKLPPPQEQKRVAISGEELSRIQESVSKSAVFVTDYLPDCQNPDLKDYDQAFRAWQTSAAPRKYTDEEVINLIGAYLGARIVEDLDFEWFNVTDEYGSAIGVQSKSVEAVAFPFESVRKRVEDNRFDFVYGVYHAVKTQIESGDTKKRSDPASK